MFYVLSVLETNLTQHSYQGDGEMEGSKDKQAFNSQIAVTLSQLQNNMQDVLQRLTTLEILTSSQVRPTCRHKTSAIHFDHLFICLCFQIESIPLKSCRSKSPNQVCLHKVK